MRRRPIHMQSRRQHPMPQRLNNLNNPSNPSTGLRMTNIGLDRPQPQRITITTALAIGGQQRLRLNRITQSGTRAMSFNHIHIHSTHTSISQRRTNNLLLSRPIRSSQPIRSPILINRRPRQHRQHLTTLPARIRQPLQHQHTRTLTKSGAIGSIGKRFTPPINRQPPLPTKRNKTRRPHHHRGPTSQRQITLPRPQRLRSQMQRHQRRRTRRIHRNRRTIQPQHIRNPPRSHTRQLPSSPIPLRLRRTHPILIAIKTQKHPSSTAPQTHRIHTRSLQRLPRHLQQQPLLRIHHQRLTRRHPKKPSIKTSHIINKPTTTGIRLALNIGIRVKQPPHIPTPINRKLTDHITPPRHHLPQIPRRTHPTRIPTPHPHHRNRLRQPHSSTRHRTLRNPLTGNMIHQIRG